MWIMKVSVIIPCHNVKDYIENCINSVFEQTYKNIELIVVDNNSTDGTLEKCMGLRDRIHFELIQEKKQGACFARNTGLSMANGEWIQFLDADDALKKDKVKNQIDLVISSFQADVIVGNYIVKTKMGVEVFIEANKENWKGLFETRLGITSANLFSKATLVELGGWNENLKSSQDYELMFRILKKGGRVYYDSCYNSIKNEREHGQITQSDPERNWHNIIELRKKILFFLQTNDKEYFEKNKNWFYQKFFELIRCLYPYNKKLAIAFLNEIIPKDFSPRLSDTITKKYLFFYRFLGFVLTEEVQILKRRFI